MCKFIFLLTEEARENEKSINVNTAAARANAKLGTSKNYYSKHDSWIHDTRYSILNTQHSILKAQCSVLQSHTGQLAVEEKQ